MTIKQPYTPEDIKEIASNSNSLITKIEEISNHLYLDSLSTTPKDAKQLAAIHYQVNSLISFSMALAQTMRTNKEK